MSDSIMQVDFDDDLRNEIIDIFDEMYPPNSSVPVEHLHALPEDEFNDMKVKVVSRQLLIKYCKEIK